MAAKEIWHVWDGDITRDMSFMQRVKKVSFSDGSFLIVDNDSPYREKPIMWYLWGKWCNAGVRAYTLGETRERVECPKYIQVSNTMADTCPRCQGRGYTWKLGEKK
jgi:hypothetical protein